MTAGIEPVNPVTRVHGRTLRKSASFTRPANTTAYTSGDLIANSTTAADVDALSWANLTQPGHNGFKVRRAVLHKADDDLTAATFRLHLFSADPCATAPANGDNGALTGGLTIAAGAYLGYFNFDMTTAGMPDLMGSANQMEAAPAVGSEINVELAAGGTLYGLLEARAGYTPASAEVFTVHLEIQQD